MNLDLRGKSTLKTLNDLQSK